MIADFKLYILLVLYVWKRHIEARTKRRRHYNYYEVKVLMAFSLAEVLITLTIVGVLASLTIPSLINFSNDYELHQALKKVYSDISQATRRISVDNGGPLWNMPKGTVSEAESRNMSNEYKKYLNYTKEGGFYEITPKNYYFYKSSIQTYPYFDAPALQLANGVLLGFVSQSNAATLTNGTGIGYIYVDLNGFKGPNMCGKDFHAFWIAKNNDGSYSVVPMGTRNDLQLCKVGSVSSITSNGCTTYALYDKPMP